MNGIRPPHPSLFILAFQRRRVYSDTMSLLSMMHGILIALAVCFLLFCSSCAWSPESSFFSSFSTRQLVERNSSAAGMTCDPIGGGGGGGVGSRAGGIGSGGAHFNSHKSDSFACRLKSSESFDETKLFTALKLDVERTLHDSGAQITDSGSTGAASFYLVYDLKNVRGRVQVSGKQTGAGYYNVHADLEETGN